jgi:SAM-dependent methyltransferase
MENVKKSYTDFHKSKHSKHVYPTEWVIRTFLGKYPDLYLNKNPYSGAKILDLGFGDCRNMPLLKNCNFDIYGVEISEDIVSLAESQLASLGISSTLKKGSNTDIPFADNFFDYILACHSCYYVDKNTSFKDNLNEIARVLNKGGTLVASLPAPDNFILKNCDHLEDGHVIIRNDLYDLRNGYIFKSFNSKQDVIDNFQTRFKNIVVCECKDNFWGVQINYFLVSCEKS